LLRNGLLLSEDDFHRQQRKLVSPAFHFHNLKEMVPLVVQSTQACMQKWVNQLSAAADAKDGVQVEISKEMTKLTLNAVSTAAFGSAFHDDVALSDQMTSNLKIVLDAIQARTLNLTGYLPIIKNLPCFGLPQLQRGCTTISNIVAKIVADRKAGKSHAIGGARML
jgi:cytochrome P450